MHSECIVYCVPRCLYIPCRHSRPYRLIAKNLCNGNLIRSAIHCQRKSNSRRACRGGGRTDTDIDTTGTVVEADADDGLTGSTLVGDNGCECECD